MKSLAELEDLLLSEINENLENLQPNNSEPYYNNIMGDTSFILAAVIEANLSDLTDWEEKWIDDCLLTKINHDSDNKKIIIYGVAIWGEQNTSEQWTSPFYFEGLLLNTLNKYFLLFGDLSLPKLTYEEFNNNRLVWECENYFQRNWQYTINKSFDVNNKK